jgi:hypothetical protein
MIIKYDSAVKTNAGWRSVTITAKADKISEKRVTITEIVDIDGNGASGYASRTGAKRQQYNVGYFAKQQVGLTKNLSACEVSA